MKMWAVFDRSGAIIVRSICEKRSDARDRAVWALGKHKWEWAYKDGYRCKRITVTVEGES